VYRNRKFNYFNSFLVDFKSGNCPSARCSSANNAICKNIGIFNGKSVSINDFLHFDIFTKLTRIHNRFYANFDLM
jgi:uncharacterized protein (UPF0179 family)